MSPWQKLLERPHSGGHFVQLYETDEAALGKNVGTYIWEGLRRGEGALLIATPAHLELFSRQLNRLGGDAQSLRKSGQLAFFDAEETLARFIVEGQPDFRLFEGVVDAAMRQVNPLEKNAGLRAYGEMVGILWKARRFAAAIRLEQLWNKLLERSAFSLYCAYAIDIFARDFDVGGLEEILCTHSHLVPAQMNGDLETAINMALDDLLGPKADALRIRIKANYRPASAVMPSGEAMAIWLRKNLPQRAEDILSRSRHYYNQLLQQHRPVVATP
jgi:hypothetical protein